MEKLSGSVKLRCKECGGQLVRSKYGELVCSNCGLVYDKIYLPPLFEIEPLSDFSASSKVYVSPDGKPLQKNALGSIIIKTKGQFKDIKGNELNYKKFQRLHLMNSFYSKSGKMRANLNAYLALRRLCSLLKVPKNVLERACYIYFKATNLPDRLGTTYQVAASAVLIASRELKYPLTLKELSSTFADMGHKILARSIAKVAAKITYSLSIKKRIRSPEDYLTKIISTLKENKRLKYKINYILDSYEHYFNLLLRFSYIIIRKIEHNFRVGKNPYLFAVSVVYLADKLVCRKLNCSPILSQKFLAENLGSTEYTIRQHYRYLKKYLKN